MPTSARGAVAHSPEISVKSVHAAWADVGIGPYKRIWGYIRIRRGIFVFGGAGCGGGQPQICTAPCRGRCRSQPFATKERYGCGSAACRYTSARGAVAHSPEISVKSVHAAWADVGIGPYKRIWGYIRIRRGIFVFGGAGCGGGQPQICTAPCRGRCPHRPVGQLRIRRRFP